MDHRTDREVLETMDLHERQGLSMAQVAPRVGRSRSAVCGLVKRINDAADAVPDLAVRPENRDGGMPARWWEDRATWG
jgi:transposase